MPPSCYRCGGPHYAPQCPQATCYTCGCQGHISPNCPSTTTRPQTYRMNRDHSYDNDHTPYKLWYEDEFPNGLNDHKFVHETGKLGASGLPNEENFFNDCPTLYLSQSSIYRDMFEHGFIEYEKQNNDNGKTKQFFDYHRGGRCYVLILINGFPERIPCTIKWWRWNDDKQNYYIHLKIDGNPL